jgi:hypothetical protein
MSPILLFTAGIDRSGCGAYLCEHPYDHKENAMFTNVTYAMSPSHPRWDEFLERLCGPEGCDFKAKGWTCFGDVRFSRKVLSGMGLDAAATDLSIGGFRKLGGYCDCEVVFNVEESDRRLNGPMMDTTRGKHTLRNGHAETARRKLRGLD